MLFSVSWIRALCPIDEPVRTIADALTARGLTVDSEEHLGDDTVLDVDVPANRPDCLGHRGLARELGAAFGVALAPVVTPEEADGPPVTERVRIEIEAPDLCPRYSARVVSDVRIGPSPEWAVRRLEACGLRSINNVVDASNLVLLELGHPIHTFDLELLSGTQIRVRRARPGEPLRTLDGTEFELSEQALVIADAERAVAVAGVMGGAETEIHEGTRHVLIEAASFQPASVRRTARALGLLTDASHRFERGVDPEGVVDAQNLAARLLTEMAGSAVAPGMIDVYPGRREPRELTLRPARVGLLLGYDPGATAIEGALRALGIGTRAGDGGALRVTIPSWRPDLQQEADLVEEVARHQGYDRIPAELPGASGAPSPPSSGRQLEERASDLLAHLGFHEAFNYAMIGPGEDDEFVFEPAPAAVGLVNPISEPLSRLRRSLIPGLVRSVDRNLRRGVRDVRLFEVGHVFHGGTESGFPSEPVRAGLAWTGAAAPRHWSRETSEAGLEHLAGAVEAALGVLCPGLVWRREPVELAGLHPGRSLSWVADGARLAWGGELHPVQARRLDLTPRILLAEMDLSACAESPTHELRFVPVPRVPATSRDLALVLGPGLSYRQVRETLEAVDPPAPARFEVIDRYQGHHLAQGEVSLTVRVILEPQEKSLTDAETESYREALVRALGERLSVRLRA